MRRGRAGEWRQEGRGLQGTARVQQSDSCGQEAVSQPGGFALKAPQLPTRGKRQEHVVSGVGGVFHDADGELQRSKVKGRLLPAVLCAAFTTLCRDFLSAAVQLPCHTEMQVHRTLHCTVVEAPQSGTPQLPKEVETLVGFLSRWEVFALQVRSLDMYTARLPEAGDHFHSCSTDVPARAADTNLLLEILKRMPGLFNVSIGRKARNTEF